jgi:hypothetical protein
MSGRTDYLGKTGKEQSVGKEVWDRLAQNRYGGDEAGSAPSAVALSDGDKYRWIRANRGNFAIVDALHQSEREADFDSKIEAAIHLWITGRNFRLDGLPNSASSERPDGERRPPRRAGGR